jgi:hypothetical protein
VLEVEVGELLLVRFSPMNASGLVEDAEDSANDSEADGKPRVYSISTFGLTRAADETVDDLVLRVCGTATCGGRTIWPVAASSLTTAGLQVQLSEPPPDHYDVILGSELEIPDAEELVKLVEELVNLFEPGRRRNPAWKKTS